MKIQFGSGSNNLEGWVNTELGDVDITKTPLPYPDGVVDAILAEHVCEHVTTPEFFRFLCDCYRILAPGGTLLICMPVLDRLSKAHAIDMILGHGHLGAYTVDSLNCIVSLVGFSDVMAGVARSNIEGHHKVIGVEKDDLETHRILLIK